MSVRADRLDLGRLAGCSFGVTESGDVWVGAETYGNEPAALWQLLAAHAAGWQAIRGTRKRLPAHRLKLCSSCGLAALTVPQTTRCRLCRTKRKLTEVRLIWSEETGPGREQGRS